MAIITSGASVDYLTVDPTSKALRITNYTSFGREVSYGQTAVFSCSINNSTPPGTPTDVFMISGSPTKVVRVLSLVHATVIGAAVAGSVRFFLLKRFSPNWQNNSNPGFPIPGVSFDSLYGPTAVCQTFNVNPQFLGGLVGTMNIKTTVALPAIPGSWGTLSLGYAQHSNGDNAVEMIPANKYMTLDQDITLRGVNEMLCLNFNGAALITSQISWYSILWTESDK